MNNSGQPLLQNAAPVPATVPTASAPPLGMPTLFAPEEFAALLSQLPPGSNPLPSEATLQTFRIATYNRLLWSAQMREIRTRVDGGAHLFQEAYERGLLVDPQNLTADDGEWASHAMQTMQALLGYESSFLSTPTNQAFTGPVTLIRYDGLATELTVDLRNTTAVQVGQYAAQQLGNVFHPEEAVLVGVGELPSKDLKPGAFVRLTGLVANESLNGQVGRITCAHPQENAYDVATHAGVHRVHQDSCVPSSAATVVRSAAFPLDPQRALGDLGILPGSRILWLEQPSQTGKVARAAGGALDAIKSQFFALDIAGDRRVSAGELRNFLWNLNLSDGDFKQVQKRFAPEGNYVEMEDILFLLGRPHIKCPDVPVDALIYEAVVSILGRRTTAHIDKDLSKEDKGVGYGNACATHCASYTTSLILQGIVFFNLVVIGGAALGEELDVFDLHPDQQQTMLWVALGAYVIYLIHLGCCVRLTSAFANEIQGMDNVLNLMERPRHEHPHFNWHVQCYHYRTVHYTTTDSKGNTHRHTRQERVNTHSAYERGVIPSTDRTPAFVPLTEAQQTQIDTHLDLDLSDSNYMTEFYRWCSFHRRDIHQDKSHSEDLPSRASSCLAVWVARSKPCWINACCYWLANIFLFSCLYRFCVQARLGSQQYHYCKKCYNIQTRVLCGRSTAGGAAAIGVAAGIVAAVGLAGALS